MTPEFPQSAGSLSHMAAAFVLLCATLPHVPAAEQRSTFEAHVQTVLETHCVDCHGDDLQEAGLNLNHRDGLLAGGESGPAIIPGSPDTSLLLQKILRGAMPPEEPKPAAEDIAAIRQWIAHGAIRAGEQPADVQQLFAQMHVSEAQILTNIFAAYCITCHGKSRQEAGLDLRTRDSILQGGKSGPAMILGKPSESLVYQKILADEMPPKKNIFGDANYVYRVQAGDIDQLKLWIELGAPADAAPPGASNDGEPQLSEADEQHWAFQPLSIQNDLATNRPDSTETTNPIDAFLLERLAEQNLTLSPPANRLVLLRRAYFDLTGLPPSPQDVDDWLTDTADDAFERLLERLLTSPRYGERQARQWLDLAGYSDTHGVIDRDELRRFMWRYRDYVIRSFNDDKPYDQFLVEQLAGDELCDWRSDSPLTPAQIDGLVATGFLRTAPDATDEGAYNKIVDRFAVLNEQLDIVSTAVMGITMECSRCHSHKFDPIPHRDYYRFAAIFRSALDPYDWRIPNEFLYPPKYNVPPEYQRYVRHESDRLTPEVRRYNAQLDAEAAPIKDQLEEAAADWRNKAGQPLTIEQLNKQFPEFAKQTAALQQQLQAIRSRRIERMLIHGVTDLGGRPTPVHVLRRGDERAPLERVTPGVPAMLAVSTAPLDVVPPEHSTDTSGNRLALARWLTRPDHPLTARVMVNRIWQHHFGRPLVTTPGNFGRSGAAPSHPELLDWLAAEFVQRGWSIKQLHRLILSSKAWQQSSRVSELAQQRDPDNVLLSRFPFRRLDAEQIRDAVLQVSGQLDLTPFGPADEIRHTAAGEILTQPGPHGYRRSIYMVQRRLKRQTMLELFDAPSMVPNCLQRTQSTVAPQALQFWNSSLLRDSARLFADRVSNQAGDDASQQIRLIYRTALARDATPAETAQAADALQQLTARWQQSESTDAAGSPATARQQALSVFCLTILNSPEFMYVD